MNSAPWVKFFSSDFLNGVSDLQADEIGVYTVILSLIWDRGAPIPDDPSWIARRAGTSTRRFNQIRARLIELGKIQAKSGLLGNRRALEVVKARDKKSNDARSAALARWYGEPQPELPLDLSQDYLENKPGKSQEQNDLKSGKSKPKPQKTAKSAMQTHDSLSRARATPEARGKSLEEESSSTASLTTPGPAVVDADAEKPPDLMALTVRLCRLGGVASIRPTQIAANMDTVKAWLESGYDLDDTITPSIEKQFADTSEEQIGSLNFYSSRIAKRHAQMKRHRASKPPEQPLLYPEDEDRRFLELRQDLLQALGQRTFVTYANLARFEAEENAKGEPVLRIRNKRDWMRLYEASRIEPVRKVAAQHGFTQVWG